MESEKTPLLNRPLYRVYLSLFVALFMGVCAASSEELAPQFGKDAIRLKAGNPARYSTCELIKLPGTIKREIRPDDRLYFSFGLRDAGWEEETYLYHYSVWLKKKNLPPLEIFYVIIDPELNKWKGWNDITIDLAPYAGPEAVLTFSSRITDRSHHNVDVSTEQMVWGAQRVGDFRRQEEGPNIILISLDTLRADRVSANGYFRKTSPNLDALAARGVNFKEAISQAPWTRPSHMSVFTGFYPSYHGVNKRNAKGQTTMRSGIRTLAEVLKDQGYRTYALNGMGNVAPNFGFFRGFDRYDDAGSKSSPKDAILVFREGAKWIEKHSHEKFFIFLHTYEIHAPYIHDHFLNNLKNPTEAEATNAKYDSGIFFTDYYLGELRKKLDALKLTDKTLIVIFSDHGEDLGSHYPNTYHGHSLYDELIRVPLIFSAPHWFKPRAIENYQARLIDIMPTILDFIGCDTSFFNFQGKSLLGLLKGGKIPSESLALSEAVSAGPERISMRLVSAQNKFKFILAPGVKKTRSYRNYNEKYSQDVRKYRGREFYDLSHDVNEKHNIPNDKNPAAKDIEKKIVDYYKLNSKAPVTGTVSPVDPELEEQLKSLGY